MAVSESSHPKSGKIDYPPSVNFAGHHPFVVSTKAGARLSGHMTFEEAFKNVNGAYPRRIYGVHQGYWKHLGMWKRQKRIS